MKKVLVSLLAIVAVDAAIAQDLTSKKGENYLPEAGDWAIGFNADGIFRYVGNSFNGNLNNGGPSLGYLNEGTFVGKKFINDKNAYRVLVNFRYQNTTQTLPYEDFFPGQINDVTIVEYSIQNLNLALGVGKEWRRGKTRLQGFYGADALVTLYSNSMSVQAIEQDLGYEYKTGVVFGASVRGFLGAEYFLFPKIAIGAQYTWGVNVAFGGKASYDLNGNQLFETENSSHLAVGGVGISSINLTLHF